MKTFFVSDLHLCDGGPRDRFAWGDRPARFNAFLDYVGTNRLIIGGDLFDLWQCNVSKALTFYEPLLKRLDAMQARYIVGNHDIDLVHFIGQDYLNRPFFSRMSGPLMYWYKNCTIKFMHGHEGDDICCDETPSLGHLLTVITGMLADHNHGPMHGKWTVEQLFIGLLDKMLRGWQRWQGIPTRDTVAGLKKFIGPCDMIVAGHTHTPLINEWYANAGCWCEQRNTFIQVEDNGDTGVYEWPSLEKIV